MTLAFFDISCVVNFGGGGHLDIAAYTSITNFLKTPTKQVVLLEQKPYPIVFSEIMLGIPPKCT